MNNAELGQTENKRQYYKSQKIEIIKKIWSETWNFLICPWDASCSTCMKQAKSAGGSEIMSTDEDERRSVHKLQIVT